MQHKAKQLRPSSSGGGHSSEPDVPAAAATGGTDSSSLLRNQQQTEQGGAGSSKHKYASGTPLAFSSCEGTALPSVQVVGGAVPGSMSSMDAPVSPRDLARSISTSAPGPVGSSSSIDSSTAPSSSSSAGGTSSTVDTQHRSSSSSSSLQLPGAAVRLAGGSSSSSAELSSRGAHLSSSGPEVLSSSLPEGLPGLAALRVSPAAARHASFLGNGIAGAAALQCGSPLCGDGSPVQLTPSYSGAAGGSSDIAAGASAVQGHRSSSGSNSKLGPTQQQQQQHSFAGFGGQMAASAQAMFGGLPGSRKVRGGRGCAAALCTRTVAVGAHYCMLGPSLSLMLV
jgi:hypothetical protein